MTLRPKLALAAIGIAALSGLIVALVARRATSRELYVQLEHGDRDQTATAAQQATDWLARDSSLAGLSRALDEAARRADRQLVLLDAQNRCVGSAPAELCHEHITVSDGNRLTIEGDPPTGDHRELIGAPPPPQTGGGRPLTLFVLPRPLTETEPGRLLGLMTRGLWLGGAVAAIFAVAISVLIARALVQPVAALTMVARRMEGGDLSARVGHVGRDEIGMLGAAFNVMAASLARQEGLRQDLFHDVAHELRTPLASLRCQIEALEDGLAPADREHLAAIHTELLRLTDLVDDLRDLGLADAGRLELDRVWRDLMVDVRAAVRAAAPAATARGIGIDLTGPESAPADVDPKRLAQILGNLLSNAVRHAAARVHVAVATEANEATITVEDDGPGISPDQLGRVFERFFRVDAARSREHGGVGLGLAITKRLTELHGGQVCVDSVPGRTRFTVRLPAASTAGTELR